MCFTFVFPVTISSYHWHSRNTEIVWLQLGNVEKRGPSLLWIREILVRASSDVVLWLLVIKMGFTKQQDLNLLKISPFCTEISRHNFGILENNKYENIQQKLNKINEIRQYSTSSKGSKRTETILIFNIFQRIETHWNHFKAVVNPVSM